MSKKINAAKEPKSTAILTIPSATRRRDDRGARGATRCLCGAMSHLTKESPSFQWTSTSRPAQRTKPFAATLALSGKRVGLLGEFHGVAHAVAVGIVSA